MHIEKMGSEVIFVLKQFPAHITSAYITLIMHVTVNVVHGGILKDQTTKLTLVDIISLHQMSDELFSCEINK